LLVGVVLCVPAIARAEERVWEPSKTWVFFISAT
jgi:hypothetical protein